MRTSLIKMGNQNQIIDQNYHAFKVSFLLCFSFIYLFLHIQLIIMGLVCVIYIFNQWLTWIINVVFLYSANEGWINPPLRFHDEPCRHKVLDLIGDLSLFAQWGSQGLPVAHIVAYKACFLPNYLNVHCIFNYLWHNVICWHGFNVATGHECEILDANRP